LLRERRVLRPYARVGWLLVGEMFAAGRAARGRSMLRPYDGWWARGPVA
jgi:hypothetical protein